MEIDGLKQLVHELSDKICSLEAQPPPVLSGHTGQMESTSVADKSITTTNQKPVLKARQLDVCKYNLVEYGISECLNGTKHPVRVKHDIESSVSILSKLNDDIQVNSVRDT